MTHSLNEEPKPNKKVRGKHRVPVKLTDKSAKTLAGPVCGERYIIHWDDNLMGFGLRITQAGARSFVLNYRALNGTQRRLTVGGLPEMKAAVAREEAKKLKAKADLGSDPMQQRHEVRASVTMRDLAKRYVDEWARPRKRPSSIKNDEIMLNRHILPVIGSLRVNAVKYADIDRLHRKVTLTVPITANRCMSLLSKMFSLAIRWEMRADNPTKGISKNYEEGREVYLDGEALARLHAALAEFPGKPSADVVRLLLLTGARRGEVLSARWSQINLRTGTWVKPSSHTKQKKVHYLPLNHQAQELLHLLYEKRGDSDYVFPGRVVGPQTDLKKFWRTLSTRAGLKGTRIHDLRHTHASLLANSGESLQTIGLLLGHSSPSTTAKYSHLNDAALRAASAIAGEAMAAAGNRGKAVASVAKPSSWLPASSRDPKFGAL